MAIQLNQTQSTGVTVNYFRISGIRVSRPFNGTETATISVDSFLSQSARQAGAVPISSNSYAYSQSDVTTPMAYLYLMSLPDFQGAVQV